MKITYRGLYIYLGWNGFIFALDFTFRKKWHTIDITLGHYWEEDSDCSGSS